MTGAELVDRIDREASRRGISRHALVSQLSRHPSNWIRQLLIAERPKPVTVARVEALLAGEGVPPPAPNNFQAKPSRPRPTHIAAGAAGDEDLPPAVFRDPCPRCGVRADIGCEHHHARLSMGAFA